MRATRPYMVKNMQHELYSYVMFPKFLLLPPLPPVWCSGIVLSNSFWNTLEVCSSSEARNQGSDTHKQQIYRHFILLLLLQSTSELNKYTKKNR